MEIVNKITEDDICIGLMTSETADSLPGTLPYKERSKGILKGYAKNIKNIFFFTDADIDDERYFNVSNNDSSLGSNKAKFLGGILKIYEMNLNCKYYILGDDDNYFFIKNILKFLNQQEVHDKLVFYGRDINNKDFAYWHDTSLSYCGGGGMIFNKKSFKVLSEYIKENYKKVLSGEFSDYADVSVGYICKYNNIKLIQDDRFHTVSYADHTPLFDEDEFWDEKCTSLLEDVFSLHYIRDEGTIDFVKKYYEEA